MQNDQSATRPSQSIIQRGSVSRWGLFSGFLFVGMFGFGGVAAALYHVLVERRRWLTAEEYASTLALGQVLPGANLVNMTVIVGDRFQGAVGAVLALTGLVSVPLISLVAIALLFDSFSYLPDVQNGATAAAAGAVGLTVGTAMKLARAAIKNATGLVVAAGVICSVGLFHLPMLPTILVLVPLSIAGEFWSARA